jgi:NAD-dependent deacetylase
MNPVRRVATLIGQARTITVLTGAGVSAVSGVPTFRGEGGLWRSYRPEDLATPAAFRRDPQLVWEWYDWRRGLIAGCRPNAAHEVLARWSRRPQADSGERRHGFALITQNVDGLHELAGTRDVVRFHGSIWELRCAQACGGVPAIWEDRTPKLATLPPMCRHCGGLARPNVVWFGEPVDPVVLRRCQQALDCDVFLSIGTSSLVYPAAGLVFEAKQRGALTVEINPAATEASGVMDVAIAQPAQTALPAIDSFVQAL